MLAVEIRADNAGEMKHDHDQHHGTYGNADDQAAALVRPHDSAYLTSLRPVTIRLATSATAAYAMMTRAPLAGDRR